MRTRERARSREYYVGVPLSAEEHERLERLAEEEERSKAFIVRRALQEHLAKQSAPR